MRTRHVSTVIRRPSGQVYDFARDPANLGTWAAGLASGQVSADDGDGSDTFVADSPMGRVSVRFVPRNDLGVLDHEVTLPDGSTTSNPLRVVPHPEGAEVIFTLRGDDDEVEQDAAMVAADLARLRAVFEGPSPAEPTQSRVPAITEPGIRVASSADAGSLGRMLYEFNTEFDAATPEAHEAARRFELLLRRDDVLAVVVDPVPAGRDLARDGDDPVPSDGDPSRSDAGFALLTLRPTPYSEHPLAQLEELYIRPDLRGRGLGTALIAHLLEELNARRCEECMINVDSDDLGARRFYERHGFSDVDPDSGSGMRCYRRQV